MKQIVDLLHSESVPSASLSFILSDDKDSTTHWSSHTYSILTQVCPYFGTRKSFQHPPRYVDLPGLHLLSYKQCFNIGNEYYNSVGWLINYWHFVASFFVVGYECHCKVPRWRLGARVYIIVFVNSILSLSTLISLNTYCV